VDVIDSVRFSTRPRAIFSRLFGGKNCSSSANRIKGLDSIRFILACWVAIGHIGLFPLFEGADTSSGIGWLLKGLYGASVNGPAAVIVFFVISGFCIHFPFRHGGFPRLARYYPRRYFRIVAPLATAIAIYALMRVDMPLLGQSIFWSIVCEEIYYLIYPCLLLLRRKWGWRPLLAGAFVLGIAVACTEPRAGNYPSYGWQLNWLLGLPCWLLGCVLAERSDSLTFPVSRRTIWTWRIAVWFASCVSLVLRFHASIGFPHTLNLFAVLAYFWLGREIAYFRQIEPFRRLESAGAWSYSLYLMHVCASVLFLRSSLPSLGFNVNWLLRFACVLVVSFAFYLVVERPSHAVARWLGRPSHSPETENRVHRLAA
jgi:peptidoglycan/LPS O-acetylase OafA/YrhL